jgi:hypothetical protein
MIDVMTISQRHRHPGRWLALTGITFDLAMAVALGALRFANSEPGQRQAEGPLPTLAFVALFAAPGILALTGLTTGRPVLVATGGAACFPFLISVAALPFWLPGGLLMAASRRLPSNPPGREPNPAWSIFGFFVVHGLAAVVLLSAMGQYSYTFSGGSEEGEYYLPSRAAWAVLIIAANLVITSAVARRSPRHVRPPIAGG